MNKKSFEDKYQIIVSAIPLIFLIRFTILNSVSFFRNNAWFEILLIGIVPLSGLTYLLIEYIKDKPQQKKKLIFIVLMIVLLVLLIVKLYRNNVVFE